MPQIPNTIINQMDSTTTKQRNQKSCFKIISRTRICLYFSRSEINRRIRPNIITWKLFWLMPVIYKELSNKIHGLCTVSMDFMICNACSKLEARKKIHAKSTSIKVNNTLTILAERESVCNENKFAIFHAPPLTSCPQSGK